jgi:hypothetical protein
MAQQARRPMRSRPLKSRRTASRRGRAQAAATQPIELYYWPTPNGQKVSIMLEECGLPYRMIAVNITRGEQFKPAFLKICAWNERYWRRIAHGAMPCTGCGEMTPILTRIPDDVPWGPRPHGASLFRRCARCGSIAHSSLAGRVLESAAGRDFLREHPRVKTLPEHQLEVAGRPALLNTFQSIDGTADFQAVTDLATLRTVIMGETRPSGTPATGAAPP